MKKIIIKAFSFCICFALIFSGYPLSLKHAFADTQTNNSPSFLLIQKKGPQKADGIWSVNFDTPIARYQERSLLTSTSNGDIMVITKDNILHCLDSKGTKQWERRIEVNRFYAYFEPIILWADHLFSTLFKLDQSILNRSILPNSVNVFSDGVILVSTDNAIIAYSPEGKLLWMRNQKMNFVQNTGSTMFFEQQNGRAGRLLALSSNGKERLVISLAGKITDFWVEKINHQLYLIIAEAGVDHYRLWKINQKGFAKKITQVSASKFKFMFYDEPYFSDKTFFDEKSKEKNLTSLLAFNFKLGGSIFCISQHYTNIGSNIEGRFLLKIKEVSRVEPLISTVQQSIWHYDWTRHPELFYEFDNSKKYIHGGFTNNILNQIVFFSEELIDGSLEYVISALDYSGDLQWKFSLGSRLHRGLELSRGIERYQVDQSGNIFISFIEKNRINEFRFVVVGLNSQGKPFLRRELENDTLNRMITKTIPSNDAIFIGSTYNYGLMFINSTGKRLFNNILTVLYDK